MTPQLQLHRGQDDTPGDCYRTCLAMVLDVDRDLVPHFCEHVPVGTKPEDPVHLRSEEQEHQWLANMGVARVVVPHSGDTPIWDLVDQYARLAPNAAVMLGCSLYGKANHEVVLYKGRLYDPLEHGWDAHLAGTIRYQPYLDGLYWVTILARTTLPLTHELLAASVVNIGEDT